MLADHRTALNKVLLTHRAFELITAETVITRPLSSCTVTPNMKERKAKQNNKLECLVVV